MRILEPIEDAYEGLANWEEPQLLFHYTNFEALQQIISSGVLRATHRSYLNDRSDINYGLRKCLDYTRNWNDQLDVSARKLGQEIVRGLDEKLKDISTSPFSYAVSFTEEGDGAAQWQVYGRYGRGVAIAFDFASLKDSLRRTSSFNRKNNLVAAHFVLSKVEYDMKIQEEQVLKLLQATTSCWPKAREYFVDYPETKTAHATIHLLDLLANRTFKHSGHIFESEWKATPHISGDDLVKFHSNKNVMRPYIEMKFEPLCIRKIIVGSAIQQPFADVKWALELLLRQKKLSHVQVEQSIIQLAPPDE